MTTSVRIAQSAALLQECERPANAGLSEEPTRGFEPRTPSLRGTPRFDSCSAIAHSQAKVGRRRHPATLRFSEGVRPWCDLAAGGKLRPNSVASGRRQRLVRYPIEIRS